VEEAELGRQSADRPEGAEIGGSVRRKRKPSSSPSNGIGCCRRKGGLYALQATIPTLTRSSLPRCLQRHGIGRLPQIEGDKKPKKRFKTYPIGSFHIDIAALRTAECKLYLFVAIDRTSKFAFVQLVESANRVTASAFLWIADHAV
jgi:hypothetical protein